jgi:hypothetical protein
MSRNGDFSRCVNMLWWRVSLMLIENEKVKEKSIIVVFGGGDGGPAGSLADFGSVRPSPRI